MRSLRKHYELSVAWPHSAEHARGLAAEAAAAGFDLVIAMGGDGIVHHVGQSLVGTRSVLGVIPAGTTNVLGRMLGTPRRPSSAVKMLVNPKRSHEHSVLVVELVGPDGRQNTAALFSFGVGADAAVVAKAESEPYRKYRFGSIHYARSAVATVAKDLSKRVPMLTVDAAGRSFEGIGLMAQFQDVYTYFGTRPLNLGPVRPDPVTVLIVEEVKLRRAASIIRGALGSRGLGAVKGFEVIERIDSFSMRAEVPVEVQADGEVLGLFTEVSARFAESALRIAVPQSPAR